MVILADRKLIWLMAALALLTLCALTTSPARPLQGRTVKLEYVLVLPHGEPEGACVLP
jgi:hypothetical protein